MNLGPVTKKETLVRVELIRVDETTARIHQMFPRGHDPRSEEQLYKEAVPWTVRIQYIHTGTLETGLIFQDSSGKEWEQEIGEFLFKASTCGCMFDVGIENDSLMTINTNIISQIEIVASITQLL